MLKTTSQRVLLSASVSLVSLLVAAPASAQAAAGGAAAAPATPDAGQVSEIVVTAGRLDAARSAIEPALGATSYSMPEAFINDMPAGANSELNQVVLQAPGAAQDSFGQLHIRGDHGNLQYRLNNVILPEGLSVFGQALSPRLAANIDLVTGALPAQYGLRTAGIVNITTKTGFQDGGEVGIYGGSHGVIEPSIEYGGSSGETSGFFSGSYTGTGVGIESPNGSANPIHDYSNQYQGFGYLDRILDDTSRISLIVGTSQDTFQLPNTLGLQPTLGFSDNGVSTFPSAQLNERQQEGTTYGIVSYLKTTDKFTGQASFFTRYSNLSYTPDVTGELLFNGIAQAAQKTDLSFGTQLEGVYKLSDANTVRAGLIISTDHTTSNTNSEVFLVDANGAQVGPAPTTIVDNSKADAWTYSTYLEDEWTVVEDVTLNYGLRFDQLDSYRQENQLSPRLNLVWKPTDGTTFHAGYSRYFTPPPFELVASPTVAKFIGTSGEQPGTLNDLPRSERDNYFDVGAQQKLGRLTLGIDTYDKQAKNLIDEGQFGAPIILTPFNYRVGYARGVELTGNYVAGPITAYANLAFSKAQGKDITSSQFNFSADDLAYIQNHYVYLDHDQSVTSSYGAAYSFGQGGRVGFDAIYGSGLRRDGAVPNGARVPDYTQVNLTGSQKFTLPGLGALEARLDVINLFDKVYEIRDGTGIGVGAPQFGARRGVFAGLTKSF